MGLTVEYSTSVHVQLYVCTGIYVYIRQMHITVQYLQALPTSSLTIIWYRISYSSIYRTSTSTLLQQQQQQNIHIIIIIIIIVVSRLGEHCADL